MIAGICWRGLLEQVAHSCGADADKYFHEIGPDIDANGRRGGRVVGGSHPVHIGARGGRYKTANTSSRSIGVGVEVPIRA